MTREEAIRLLNGLSDADQEASHSKADDILLMFLIRNGFEDVAKAFIEARDRVGFWYA